MFILYRSLMMTMLTLAAILSYICTVTSLDRKTPVADFIEKDQSRKDSEGSSQNVDPNQILLECPRKKNARSNVQACKNSVNLNAFLELRECDTILSFFIGNISVDVCIRRSRIILPNASITFISHKTRTYRPYHEEMSSNIKSFFTGSVLIGQRIFPFSGNTHMSTLTGKTMLNDTSFMIECHNFNAHKISANCFQCQVFCSYPETDQDALNLQKEKAFHSQSILYQYHQFFHAKQSHWKLKPKRSKSSHKMTCSLHLVSDHIFFKFVGDKNFMKTINIMIESVNKVNAIFKKNFNPQKGTPEMGFAIRQITVYSHERMKDYKLNDAYMTADEYLKQFSLYDFSSVCLGVGFTFRNFGSVVGTAFPAFSTFNTPGGICEERVKINSHYVSYNTVIMSFYSPDKPSEETLALTLTHEIGHSFGAKHDETDECLPGENVGNFIMSSMVNWGDKPNNYLFSKCSMLHIMPVVMKNKQCLYSVDYDIPVCGNTIPEDGEECDCGNSNQCDATDPCCTPADDKSHKPCMIRRHAGKSCSPKVSSCCSASCAYILRLKKKNNCIPVDVCTHGVTCIGKN